MKEEEDLPVTRRDPMDHIASPIDHMSPEERKLKGRDDSYEIFLAMSNDDKLSVLSDLHCAPLSMVAESYALVEAVESLLDADNDGDISVDEWLVVPDISAVIDRFCVYG